VDAEVESAADSSSEPSSGVFQTVRPTAFDGAPIPVVRIGGSPPPARIEEPKSDVSAEDIQQYRPVVRAVVRRICRRIPNDDALRKDLDAAGMAGLVTALRRKDRCRPDEFECYARVRVRGAVLDELRRLDWASRTMRASLRQSEDNPSSGFMSFTFDSTAIEELPAPSPAESPLETALRHSDQEALVSAVEELPERYGAVVRMHYFEALPFCEIARLLQVTPARVSQIHTRALMELREKLSSS
jgi:RNA polymerase sigma factor for flagellar operon FliA